MDHVQRQDLIDDACDAIAAGESAKALAALDQLAVVEDDFAPVHFLRAHALLLQGNFAEALDEAKRGVDLAPDNPKAQRVLSWAAWTMGKLGIAQQALENCIQLETGSPESLAEYAEFMACERGPKLGEEAARVALAADGNSATAWAALGIAQHRMHRREDAEASLMRALTIDSENSRAQWGMVRLLQDKGEHAKADALASFLKDTPGGAAFAAQVHRDASRRRAVEKLFDRPGVAEEVSKRAGRIERAWPWLVLAVLLLAAIAAAIYFPLDRRLVVAAGVVGLLAVARYLILYR